MATAEQYAQWLVDNQDKKGTPDFETVKKAYLEVRPSTASEKVEGAGRGVNVGLADIFGAPVDAINQLPKLLNLLPGEQGFGPDIIPDEDVYIVKKKEKKEKESEGLENFMETDKDN